MKKRLARHTHSGFYEEQHAVVGVRVAKTVDAGDRGYDNHIASFKQSARRGHTQAINLVIYRRLFLDVSVRSWHVSFGLVVVVVRDEIFYGVFWKEGFEFLIELRRERLVVR